MGIAASLLLGLAHSALWLFMCLPPGVRFASLGLVLISYWPPQTPNPRQRKADLWGFLYLPWFIRRIAFNALSRCWFGLWVMFRYGGKVPAGGNIEFLAAGRVWRAHHRPAWKHSGVWWAKVGNTTRLNAVLERFRFWWGPCKFFAAWWITSHLHTKGDRGKLHTFNFGATPHVKQWLAPNFLYTCKEGGSLPAGSLDHSDFEIDLVTFAQGQGLLTESDLKKRQDDVDTLWGEPSIIATMKDAKRRPIPGFITVRARHKLPAELELGKFWRSPADLELGVSPLEGQAISVPYRKCRNFAIQGIQGNGKTWWLRMLLAQLRFNPDVSRVTIMDLKAGGDYVRFRPINRLGRAIKGNEKFDIMWDWEHTPMFTGVLKRNMVERLKVLNTEGADTWRELPLAVRQEYARKNEDHEAGDHWIIVDEIAVLEREGAKAALTNLVDLAARGRAPGYRIAVATQKGTADAIPKALSNSLDTKICFCIEQMQIASGMFGSVVGLPSDPTKLLPGQYLTYLHHDQKYHLLQGYKA